MRTPNAFRWAVLIVAGATLAFAGTLKTSSGGGRCKTTPCTYYSYGKPLDGTCGAVKKDKGQCFCILNSDKHMHQVQSTCSVP